MNQIIPMKGKYLDKGAVLSKCGEYRYLLWRDWKRGGQKMVFIGLNPSTADALEDDPTIRRCVQFAKDIHCTGLVMVNLFAIRTKDPKVMLGWQGDSVGPKNDYYLEQVFMEDHNRLVAAWGNHGSHMNRDFEAMQIAGGKKIYCLGVNGNGSPKHPLYVPRHTKLREY